MDLSISSLRQQYLERRLSPSSLVENIAQLTSDDPNRVWIHRLSVARMRDYASALDGRDPNSLPLYGIPFAI